MTEVHFCNLCDQSVPQDHLEDGSAVRRSGRIVCATCREVIALAAASPRPAPSRAGILVAIAFALIGWGAAAYVWLGLQDLAGQIRRDATAQDTRQAQELQRVGDGLDARLGELLARAAAQESELAALRQATARAAESVQAQLLMLEKSAEPIPDLVDAQARQDAQLREAQTGRTILEQDLRDVRGALDVLRAQIAELGALAAARAEAPPASPFGAEVEALLTQLRDPDPLQRNTALAKLGHDGDPRLAAYVAPLLRDSYEMNRFYAAKHLGLLKAREHCDALAEALLDDYSFVRGAAHEALVAITGQNIEFDPKGNESERKKSYERWVQWLKAAS